MPRPLKTAEEMELTLAPSLTTQKTLNERRKAEEVPLTLEQREEVARLDGLIAEALQACKRGQTIRGGKRNPAFQNLSTLVKTRKYILDNAKKKAKDQGPMDELERITSAFLKEQTN